MFKVSKSNSQIECEQIASKQDNSRWNVQPENIVPDVDKWQKSAH